MISQITLFMMSPVTKDLTMSEPPPKPPDKLDKSFKEALTYQNDVGKLVVSQEVKMITESVQEGEGEVGSNSEIPFVIPPDLKDKVCKPWATSLILRLFGHQISLNLLQRRLKGLRKPKENFQLIDLGYDFCIAKFEQGQDMLQILETGPWFLGDQYIATMKWKPEFHPATAKIFSMAAWIRFANLPMKYYDANILWLMAKKVGRPIRIDAITLAQSRGRFARICVELDMERPLVHTINCGSFKQTVQYESLPVLYFQCGKIGHDRKECLMTEKIHNQYAHNENQDMSNYGTWMIVNRRSTRRYEGPKAFQHPTSNRSKGDSQSNDKFSGDGKKSMQSGVPKSDVLGRPIVNRVARPDSTNNRPENSKVTHTSVATLSGVTSKGLVTQHLRDKCDPQHKPRHPPTGPTKEVAKESSLNLCHNRFAVLQEHTDIQDITNALTEDDGYKRHACVSNETNILLGTVPNVTPITTSHQNMMEDTIPHVHEAGTNPTCSTELLNNNLPNTTVALSFPISTSDILTTTSKHDEQQPTTTSSPVSSTLFTRSKLDQPTANDSHPPHHHNTFPTFTPVSSLSSDGAPRNDSSYSASQPLNFLGLLLETLIRLLVKLINGVGGHSILIMPRL